MRWIVPVLLVATLLPVHAQTQPFSPVYHLGDANFPNVDLEAQASRHLVFEVDTATDFGASFTPHSVLVQLDCTCGQIRLTAESAGGGKHHATLPVSTPDLVVGQWTISAHGTSQSGESVSKTGTAKLNTVAPGDTAAPVLTVQGLDEGVVLLGAGQSLQVQVQDDLLRRVTYRIDGQPQPFELPFPYRLSASSFTTGMHGVTIVAEDRVGRTTSAAFNVYADEAPPSVQWGSPGILYHGIQNPIALTVREASAFTILAEVDNVTTTQEHVGAAQPVEITVDVVPPRLGAQQLKLRIVDALLNEVSFVKDVQVVQVTTDAVLVSAVQTSKGVAGETIDVRVRAKQDPGVTTLTFDLLYDGQVVGNITMPKEGTVEQTVPVTLRPGRFDGVMSLRAPEAVIELDPTDQALRTTLEVFLARVEYGSDVYHIRGDALGLPQLAVDAAGATYPLELRLVAGRSVYGFDAAGAALYWDPATNSTQVPVVQAPPADEKAPGLALAPLALLGMAALRRRR